MLDGGAAFMATAEDLRGFGARLAAGEAAAAMATQDRRRAPPRSTRMD